MTRVLVCAFACSPGGCRRLGDGEAVLGWSIVRQLARFHEVWILTHPWNREGIEKGITESGLDIRVCYFDAPRAARFLSRVQGGFQISAYFWQIKAFFVARRLHRENPFDLFHHVTYANDWMASFIGAFLPIPYVRGPGGGAQYVPKKFLAKFSRRGRFWERVRALGQKVLRKDPFFLLSQRRARRILVCTPEARMAIPGKWRDKVELFPVNGIGTEDLRLADRDGRPAAVPGNGQQKEFRVLSAGKLLELKAFDLAIRAFGLFARNVPEATFTLVGDGPELARLEMLIAVLGLGKRARIDKWMARNDLLREMARCDVFLFPSLRDGGGAVVIEAMAAGNPIVCMNLAGPAMHVTDECGIRVAGHSPDQAVDDMAAALARLHADPDLRARMGKAARARAERNYHWHRHGDRLLRIYQEVLGATPEAASCRSERSEESVSASS